MADNPIAFLREVLVEALTVAGFERVPFAPDPTPAPGKYWMRIGRADPAPDGTDVGGVAHLLRRTFTVLAGVSAPMGDSDALDAALDDATSQLRYAVDAYAWSSVGAESFPQWGVSVRPYAAGIESDDNAALYDQGRGVVELTGWIEYLES